MPHAYCIHTECVLQAKILMCARSEQCELYCMYAAFILHTGMWVYHSSCPEDKVGIAVATQSVVGVVVESTVVVFSSPIFYKFVGHVKFCYNCVRSIQ